MFKTLLKKQLRELGAFFYQNKRTGKRRRGAAAVGFGLLLVLLLGMLMVSFGSLSVLMCSFLISLELDWFYFALMGLMALVLGVFINVFTTYSSLYGSRDNELLLSLPIPPAQILAARMAGVYLTGLVYMLLVMIPAYAVYFYYAAHPLAAALCALPVLALMGLIITALSCVLGWVVAQVSAHAKHKTGLTVVLSLAFIVLYYSLYMRIIDALTWMLENAALAAGSMRSWAWPLYQLGLAASGRLSALAVFGVLSLALMGLVYWVLSRSYLRIMTARHSAARAVYREKTVQTASMRSALLRRELRRLAASSTYLLNSALGTLLLPLVGVGALWKRDELKVMAAALPGMEDAWALLVCAALCLMVSVNTISAPSVSLEGKSLWLIQSLPVPAWWALRAKLELHLLLTLPSGLVCTVLVLAAMGVALPAAALTMLAVALFVVFTAELGLLLGLKLPNLNWTSEVAVIKQGAATGLLLLGSWALVAAAGGLYFVLARRVVSPMLYLLLWAAVLAGAVVALWLWLRRRGAKIFAAL